MAAMGPSTDILLASQNAGKLAEIKSLTNAPRVVVISGGSPRMQLDFLEIAQKLCADSILYKPFTRGQLLEAVMPAAA